MEGRFNEKMRQLFRFQAPCARGIITRRRTGSWCRATGPKLLAAEIMREVYEELLNKIERRNFDVMTEPVKLSKLAKTLAPSCARRPARNARRPRPPAPKKVVVLGAGYAGLAAATELILRGHDVTLIEAPRAARRARPQLSSIRRAGSCSTTASTFSWAAITRSLAPAAAAGRDATASTPRRAWPCRSSAKKAAVSLAATAPDAAASALRAARLTASFPPPTNWPRSSSRCGCASGSEPHADETVAGVDDALGARRRTSSARSGNRSASPR